MLITGKEKLKHYSAEHRIWQGIPGIEVTKKGRIFATFYSGGIKEELENFSMLVMSDNGTDFSEPVAVAYKPGHRCFDPCIWIDPLGRLWFIWSMMPAHGTYATICENPDAEVLTFSEPKFIGHDIMMNKPTVLSTGEWLFPITVWKEGVRVLGPEFDSPEEDKKAFVYKTVDNGKTFRKMGGADVTYRSYDEHMVVELTDGRLAMYIRTDYGIGNAYSYDRGESWTSEEHICQICTSSRFFIRRLPSGRILFVNHGKSVDRNNLTAFLSEDDGKTWKYQLLLDDRENVSYPDGAIGEDGFIYVVYDRERGSLKNSLDEAYGCAREVLYAKITEEDIIAGKLQSEGSKLRCQISKLGEYADAETNPYAEASRYSDEELADVLAGADIQKIGEMLFEHYAINCVNMHKVESARLDELTEKLSEETADKKKIIAEMIRLVRSVSDLRLDSFPVVEIVKKIVIENPQSELTADEIARKAGVSKYYMMHMFKKITGTTVTAFKNALRIAQAKKLLLETEKSMTEIAQESGFGSSSYFSKLFVKSEGITPSDYRQMLKKN